MLTIVIPTRNRSAFLKRALQYYSDVACPFPIVIGDSSTGEHMAATLHFLKTFSSRLKIRHIVDPQALSGGLKGWQDDAFLRNLIDEVKTPYVAFYADDDFAVVNNLKLATDFLETNKDYSYVCGEALLLTLKSGSTHGKVATTGLYSQRAIMDSTAAQRLFNLTLSYVVLEYGVSRTEQMKKRWKKIFDARIDNLSGEILNCFLVVFQGKVKKMDQLFLVRQAHAGQSSITGQDTFDWYANLFFIHYPKIKEILTDELVEADSLSREKAAHIIKMGFWNYIADDLSVSLGRKMPKKNIKMYFKRMMENAPWFVPFFRKLYSYLPKGRFTLPALLRKSPSYHEDFMPIYRAIEGRLAIGNNET